MSSYRTNGIATHCGIVSQIMTFRITVVLTYKIKMLDTSILYIVMEISTDLYRGFVWLNVESIQIVARLLYRPLGILFFLLCKWCSHLVISRRAP